MIESVHSDDKPKGNGDDADRSRNDAPQPPLIYWNVRRQHVLSLQVRRERVQLHRKQPGVGNDACRER